MFYQIVFDSGFVNLLIWILLFVTSTASVTVCLKLFRELRRKNFVDPAGETQILRHCEAGDLDAAYTLAANDRSTLFGHTLAAVFNAFRLGAQGREDAARAAIEARGNALQRQLNILVLCGNIAPMLGLLGTVTGMVSAFLGLGTAMGPEKASILAISISQALYTTAAGLLIAVPTIAAAVMARNRLEERLEEVTGKISGLLTSFPEE